MKNTHPDSATMSTDDNAASFATGFFKSLTNPFKSQTSANDDRDKIDSTTISDDASKQLLFNQIRSGSASSRAKAADDISQWLYEFNTTSIPDIWYCAKDLLHPSNSQSVRRSAFKLLSACVDIDTSNPENVVSYFNDTLTNSQFSKDKLDPQFEFILQIVKKLTDNGSFIHHYQVPFKQPTIDFLIHTLSSSDVSKNVYIQSLLTFIVDAIQSGLLNESVFNVDSSGSNASISDNKEKNVESFLNLIFKLSLRTSDKLILEQCIIIIDTINQYHGIPSSLRYRTLEIICGSVILDLHFYELGCRVIMNLINSSDFKSTFDTLIGLIQCNESKPSDKNINAAVGSIKVLNHLFKDFSYQFDIELLISTFQEILEWTKSTLLIAILQFFNETLLQNLSLMQINLDSDKSSILKVLEVISSKITKNDELELFKMVLVQLQSLAESSRYPGSLSNLTMFFIHNSKYLSTKNSIFVLRFFVVEDLCSPLNINWLKNLDLLLSKFYNDTSKDVSVRLATLKILEDLLDLLLKDQSLVSSSNSSEQYVNIFKISDLLFEKLQSETNYAIVEEIFKSYSDISSTSPDEVFRLFLNKYIKPGFIVSTPSGSIFSSERRRSSSIIFSQEKQDPASTSSLSSLTASAVPISFPPKTLSIITKGFVNLFTRLFYKGGPKSTAVYDLLIQISQYGLVKKNTDLLLITSRFFVRLRSSADNQVYLTTPTDIEGLSAAFGRNLLLRQSKESSQNPVRSTLDEKWTYPEEIDYIPDDCLDKPSLKLVYLDPNKTKLSVDGKDLTYSVDIEKWLLLVIQILETAPDWEIYSFIYSHFCPQLSNIRLFQSNCGELIRKFRSLICDQLMLKLPSNLKIPSKISKHDLQVAIVRNFTPLISYHGIFAKADEDQIINALVFGLTSWEKTAIPCIHILTVCCYELPMSVKKYLPVILTKLQTRISSSFASAHILEFLLTIGYIPTLTSNFTVEEFKRAFGITFKLIQYAHDIKQINSTSGKSHQGILNHGEELTADFLPSTEISEITPVIPTYLLNLSYDVIANWFLNMKLSDRRQLSSFIMKNLILSQSNRGSEINDQNMSFLDLISRFTYSDLELKFNATVAPMMFQPKEPVLSSKWIFGNSLISIDTHAETGESVVTIRRASGSTVFKITPDESMIPLYTNQLHSSNEDDLFTANYILLQLIVHPDLNVENKPIAIPDETSFNRTISNFDRIPVVEFHKIGLLYIGPNQTTENEILSNTKGSKEYDDFLAKFGRTIKLKNCKTFYTGGLDTENDADGEVACGWNDKILQLIFHTTTLMPNLETDANFSNKKRHIGNDYVNIFFDESGQQFDFNVIKSQFNFLNIVIQPHSISFGGESSHIADDESSILKGTKYKVKIYRRSGVPALFSTCHFKIISAENLPTFVRTLSLVADQFAQIWHSNGNYSSNWSHRMRQFNTLKTNVLNHNQKLIKAQEERAANSASSSSQNNGSTNGGSASANDTELSFFEQLEGTSSTAISNDTENKSSGRLSRSNTSNRKKGNGAINTNILEFPEVDDNVIYKNLEFNSFTR